MVSRVSRAWSGPAARDVHPEPAAMRRGVRLAVDVGSVRVGVARSDPDGVLASPFEVIAHGRGDLDRLAALTAAEQALEVIVGLPTTLAGRQGQAAVTARQVATDLAARIAPVPVRLFDERFTTTTAHAVLRQSGKNPKAALAKERTTGDPPGELVPGPGRMTP